MQVSISSITIPPARTSGDLHQKFAPTRGLWHPSFCLGGGGDLLGQLPRGGHLSYKRCLPFSYNGKNWRLTTLWGLLVALKFFTFLKKIIQSKIEPKLIFLIKDRLRMRNSLIVRNLILGIIWRIGLYK